MEDGSSNFMSLGFFEKMTVPDRAIVYSLVTSQVLVL